MELFSVLVTGANRGIGLEFIKQFLQFEKPPKYIFATYRNRDGIQDLKTLRDTAPQGIKILLVKMDIRDMKQIEATKMIIEDVVGEMGLTLLINNAGVLQGKSFLEATSENLRFHLDVNAIGPFMVSQVMYPLLKKAATRQSSATMKISKAGILNISSFLGSVEETGFCNLLGVQNPGYKMSKSALNMGMRVIASELKKDGILVIMMCPGWVKTDMGTEAGQIEVQDSIAAMLGTISKLNEDHHGMFLDRFGKPIPW